MSEPCRDTTHTHMGSVCRACGKRAYSLADAAQDNAALREQVRSLTEERDEVRRLQRSRMSRAISIWQAFFAKPDTIPDLGELLDWMVERYNVLACKYHAEADRAEQAEQQRDAFAAAVERLLGTVRTVSGCLEGWGAHEKCGDELCSEAHEAVNRALSSTPDPSSVLALREAGALKDAADYLQRGLNPVTISSVVKWLRERAAALEERAKGKIAEAP